MQTRKYNNFDTELSGQADLLIQRESGYLLIDVDQIDPNPDQPRFNFSKEAFDRLIQSIKETGLIQPIVVQYIDGRYQIIAGERRWRAYLVMGKQQIEAIVKSVDDNKNAIYALAENIAREDLSDYEIGKAIRKIEDVFSNKKELASMIGINRTDMYRYLAFDSLPSYIQKDLNINPKLLSRSAADQIKKLLSKHDNSCSVLSFLEEAWKLLKDGKIQQTQIPGFIQNKFKELYGLAHSQSENDILTINGEQFGQVTKSQNHWSIRLMVNKITEYQQQQILGFIQQLLKEPVDQVSQVATVTE